MTTPATAAYSHTTPLVTCPDCNHSVSDAAHSCPECGRPGPFTAGAETPAIEAAAAELVGGPAAELPRGLRGGGLVFGLLPTAIFMVFAMFSGQLFTSCGAANELAMTTLRNCPEAVEMLGENIRVPMG